MIGSFIYSLVRKKRFVLPLEYVIILSGCIFWFKNAPAPRFGIGFLMLLFLLPFAQLVQAAPTIPNLFLKRILPGVMIGGVLVFLVYGYVAQTSTFNIHSLHRRNLIFQSGFPSPEIKSTMVDGQKIYNANDSLCWYAPLPCTITADPKVEFRGKSLLDGFRYSAP